MGGRSSSFKYSADGRQDSQKVKYTPLIPLEQDIQTTKHLKDVKDLNKYNHQICISTDGFKEENFNPNIAKLKELNSRFNTYQKLDNENNLKIRAAKFEGNVAACFSSYGTNKKDMTIFLSDDLIYQDKKTIESLTKIQIQSNWWSKSDQQEMINHTLCHEYGHFVQKLIIDKQLERDKVDLSNENNVNLIRSIYAKKCKRDILSICKEQFHDDNEFISRYGEKQAVEFFAEAFANLVDSKNPTNIAKATEIYIKENL